MSTGDDAPLDENSRQGLIALASDGSGARVALYADKTTHALLVEDGSTKATETTWVTGGNSSVVTNAAVTPTSIILFMCATPPAGLWGVLRGTGTFTITSSDSESSSLAFTYKVFS